mgnify:CR=1 FL=1
MPIRQADAPNHCSIANKAIYETCMVLAKLTMPFGCFATLRSLSHCLQLIRHSSRQLLCPSCHLIHFVLRSATLHHVRSLTICYKAWHTILSTKQSTSDAHTFSQATLQYLLGSIPLHYVLHSFQSHSVHLLPIILLALRTTVCVTGLH